MQTDTTLTPERLHKMDVYWRAANCLAVGQMSLYDHPLLQGVHPLPSGWAPVHAIL